MIAGIPISQEIFAIGMFEKILSLTLMSGVTAYGYMYLKTYAKFTFCIKYQGHVSDENF